MCGIYAILLNYDTKINMSNVEKSFDKGKNRGPEFSKLVKHKNAIFGFHRLAINGLNEASNQPFDIEGILLICNGEIYNYKLLYELMGVLPHTDSDCEVIIHLYLKYGIEQTLIMLDGVFAFVLYDQNKNKMFVARDPFGVRPLYQKIVQSNDGQPDVISFASELKMLCDDGFNYIQQFQPGTYAYFNYDLWQSDAYNECHYIYWQEMSNKPYFIPAPPQTIPNIISYEMCVKMQNYYYQTISKTLYDAVFKRCTTTDRPVACLLSGGLDSSLIAAFVANHFRNEGKTIETYSIGLDGSEDVKYAKIVADYIKSKHTEVIVTEDEMFNAIEEVIKAIESYDTTTVRASIGNYLIGKYISTHSDAKVIFNGDGSDELFGGYLYMNNCPDEIEFDKETRRLLNDIHMFDVLRSDKSISSNGLEPRTPFLDRNFVNNVLSIPTQFRDHNKFKELEKYLLRNTFATFYEHTQNKQILQNEILFRRKEAFSDGVSCHGRSLFSILQEKIALHYDKKNPDKVHTPSIELEKQYYKEIFEKEFPNCLNVIPYYWMPKYTNASDPSARTLDIYEK